MVDLVGTCPKDFWEEWIAEGDPVGTPESGEEWGWYRGLAGLDHLRRRKRPRRSAHGADVGPSASTSPATTPK